MRGTLKIFLGAAPGVGKTVAMLRYAVQLLEQGVDVVVGYVETHGRETTAAELRRLEVLPPLKVSWQGRIFDEVDVDAILRRRPEAVAIDELAHANAPGSRHPKRYQDVADLLEAGIDVLTTVNVQHLEPVHREAEAIIGRPVREIVPEALVNEAHLEMVDITPEALLRRLRAGELYPRGQAQVAEENFFRYTTLAALRELALRVVARDVDVHLQRLAERRIIPGPVGARENVLVCCDYLGRAERLVSTGARMARRMKADLMMLTVVPDPAENPLAESPSQDKLRALEDLARRYEARLLVEPRRQRRLGEVIWQVALAQNVTQVVMGQPRPGRRWRPWWRESPTTYLLRHMRDVDLRIVGWRERA
ncbi:MAG: universal stress protein [Firmicutes bacterium]|nr:universal stress protein [Bacillota bacterium]